MKKKSARKKINNLSLKECEAIIEKYGGRAECLYVQHVLNQYNKLRAEKELS
jgi:hypothetical protein